MNCNHKYMLVILFCSIAVMSCTTQKNRCVANIGETFAIETYHDYGFEPGDESNFPDQFSIHDLSMGFPNLDISRKNEISELNLEKRNHDHIFPRRMRWTGHKALFKINYHGEFCTDSEIDRLSGKLFKKYAKQNGFDDFEIVEKMMYTLYRYNQYIVQFQ